MWDGWLRRRVLWYLRRNYVKGMADKRTGSCVRCGRCCSGCPAHDSKNMRCRIYAQRPSICRVFPLTPEDNERIPTCGYRFRC